MPPEEFHRLTIDVPAPSPTITPTPTPTPSPNTPAGVLSWDHTLWLGAGLGAAVLLAGVIVLVARCVLSAKDSTASVVRSWIAITLVLSLVILCVATLAINDTDLRNILFGSLTTSTGLVIAFYFSTKANDQARQDAIKATVGTEHVPNLIGKSQADAKMALGTTSFSLKINNAKPPDPGTPGAQIAEQNPPGDSDALRGSPVVVGFERPIRAAQRAAHPTAPEMKRRCRLRILGLPIPFLQFDHRCDVCVQEPTGP